MAGACEKLADGGARGRHYSVVSTEQDLAGLLQILEVVGAVVDTVVNIGEDDVLVTSCLQPAQQEYAAVRNPIYRLPPLRPTSKTG